jgi:hypothetical protein
MAPLCSKTKLDQPILPGRKAWNLRDLPQALNPSRQRQSIIILTDICDSITSSLLNRRTIRIVSFFPSHYSMKATSYTFKSSLRSACRSTA